MSKESPNSSGSARELDKSCGMKGTVGYGHEEGKAQSEGNCVEVESQDNIFQLNSHVWRIIFQFLPENDIIALSSVSKNLQRMVRNTKSCFNLNKNYRLDVDCFLNFALSKTCTSIDINYCHWLTPNTINEMISKTNLRHIHLIQCQVNKDCVRSICNLHLQSLSFTYTKEWRLYFIENAQQCYPFFPTLTKLEMEFSKFVCDSLDLKAKTFIYDIFVNVFPHCKQLQHLKLIDDFEEYIFPDDTSNNESYMYEYYYRARESEFPIQSTPLPNLTSLEFDGRDWDCKLDLDNFVRAILRDKVIPINNVDFGQYTCQLLQVKILCHPLIMPHSSKFILRSYERWVLTGDEMEEDVYDYFGDELSHWIGQTSYATLFLDNISFENFPQFANIIISTSEKSIKELCFRECFFRKNVVKGLEMFAINCPQITALNLTIKGNMFSGTAGLPRNHDLPFNEAVIETIAKFKNLKELIVSPKYLKCNYKNEDESPWIKMISFWKVIRGCEQLNKICLLHSEKGRSIPTIHVDNLYDISHCKNLKVLQLNRFKIEGNEDFQLSKITRWCSKLEHISIVNVSINGNFILNLEESLKYLKDLKILRIRYGRRYLTETFLNSLCSCKQLENISLNLSGNLDVLREDAENLIQVLPKVKNLFVFKLELNETDEIITEQLNLLFDKIKKDRPAFSGDVY